MVKRVLIIILLFLLNSELFSQQYYFRKYSVEEGLPQSFVYCLLQDSRGFIWMGTVGGGVTRFDGTTFKTYTVSDGLTDNIIRSLFEDSKGNIWIGTDNGLTIFDGKDFRQLDREHGLNASSVLKITESENGMIWIGTNDAGLFGIQLADSIRIVNFSMDDGLISTFINDIYEDNSNRLWLAMVGGINILEFGATDSIYIKKLEDPLIPTNFVLTLQPTASGELLAGTNGDGLFIAKTTDQEVEFLSHSINENYPGLVVWDILAREDGEIWLGTGKNGVISIRDKNVSGSFNRDNGLPSNQILGLLKDIEGNTWFATYDQGAVMFADDKFVYYDQTDGIKGNQILGLHLAQENKLYVGTEEGLNIFRKTDDILKPDLFYSLKNEQGAVGATVITGYKGSIYIGTNDGVKVFDGSRVSDFQLNSQLPDKQINALLSDSKNNLWIGTSGGYAKYTDGKIFTLDQNDGLVNNEVQTIIEDRKGRIWLGTLGGLAKLDGITYSDYTEEDGLTYKKINCLTEDDSGNIWIGTFGGGIFRFEINKDSLPVKIVADGSVLSSDNINSLKFISPRILIAGSDKGFDLIEFDDKMQPVRVAQYGLGEGFAGGENNPNSLVIDSSSKIWFGTKNGLVRYDPTKEIKTVSSPSAYISSLKLFFEDVDWEKKGFKTSKWAELPVNLTLSHNNNHLTFEFTGISFSNPEGLTFSYCLERRGTGEWSPFSSSRRVPFSNLEPGKYKFNLVARSRTGIKSEPVSYSFIIEPPFWKTAWFISAASLLFLILVVLVMKWREKNLVRENLKLERIVEQRTREVVEQKDEIARQRDIVTFQKKEITDSIHYAETIQQAILPEEMILKEAFADYFILFKPRDIVSGDFYWIDEKDGKIIFTVADCTGHGVPGALMSMLGISFLNKIINESGILEPSRILDELRKDIIRSLKQKSSFEASKDGMDIALCSFNPVQMKLKFAGANNPLFLFRKEPGELRLIEIKGDNMPVAFFSNMSDFTCKEIDVVKGDTLFLFSDGFCDQFGGPAGRKFMKQRFITMLMENQDLDMPDQKAMYEKTLSDWMNYPFSKCENIGQVDDILLLGIRI